MANAGDVVPAIGFGAPKLKPAAVVAAMGNPVVAAVVDTFAASNVRPAAAGMGVPLLARCVKLGRLDAVDMDVVVAVTPPPSPKPLPVAMVAMVAGVPKVRPVSACGTKSKPSE